MSSYVTFFWSADAVIPYRTAVQFCVGLVGDSVISSNVMALTCVAEENRRVYSSELFPASPFDGPESLSSQVDPFSHAVKLNHTHYYWFLEAASSAALGYVNQLCWFYVLGYICDKRKFWSNPKSQWFPKAGHPSLWLPTCAELRLGRWN